MKDTHASDRRRSITRDPVETDKTLTEGIYEYAIEGIRRVGLDLWWAGMNV